MGSWVVCLGLSFIRRSLQDAQHRQIHSNLQRMKKVAFLVVLEAFREQKEGAEARASDARLEADAHACRNTRFFPKVEERPLFPSPGRDEGNPPNGLDGAQRAGRNVGEAYPRVNTTPADVGTVPQKEKNLLGLLACVILSGKTNICV